MNNLFRRCQDAGRLFETALGPAEECCVISGRQSEGRTRADSVPPVVLRLKHRHCPLVMIVCSSSRGGSGAFHIID